MSSSRTVPRRESRSLLTISDLVVSYGDESGTGRAVDGVDLQVHRGETVALVGESGSGKSTTALAVVGLLARGVRTSGRIEFDGDRIDNYTDRAMSRVRGARIGFVPQDPGMALNPVQRVGAQVAEVLRIHRRADRRRAKTAVLEHLRNAGIDDPELRARQLPHQLSGGQRQRVLIAIAMACDPDLVIADEPTSALDVTVQQRILDHLEQRVRESGAALLLITHDIGVAADRADRIAVMSGGRVVETASAVDVLTTPHHAYTRRLIGDAPGLNSRRLVGSAPDGMEDVVTVEQISRRFRVGRTGRVQAVDDVSLRVRAGETLSLVGESGSGKTTTARIIAGLEAVDSGTVMAGDRRGDIGFVYQNPYSSMNPKMTVGEIISEPLRRHSKRDKQIRVAELLTSVGLDPTYAQRTPAALSGGQRQRAAIARALASSPRLLILDEPVSALDVTVQTQILRLLVDLQAANGTAYLFISHDLAVVRQISHRVAVMRAGRIVEESDAEDLFTRPSQDYTRSLIEAIPGDRLQHRIKEPTRVRS